MGGILFKGLGEGGRDEGGVGGRSSRHYEDAACPSRSRRAVDEEDESEATSINLSSEASVHRFLQVQYSLARGRRCRRCRPAEGNGEIMSLIDLCIDSICQNILCYEVPPSFDVLPPDLVRRIFDSLTRHKALTKLTVADLTACAGLRTGGLAAFRESWSMTSLTLNGCRNLTDEAVKPLVYLSALQHLRLRGCWQLSDAALNALAPLMPQLKTLDVNACRQFSSTSISFCVGKMREIRHLDLGYCPRGVGRGALEYLTRGPASTTLQVLILDSSRSLSNADLFSLGNGGLVSLLPLKNLKRLNLADTGVSNGGMDVLAKLSSLSVISLFYTSISDSGVRQLSALQNLTDLNLDNRDLTDTSLLHLSSLTKLRRLDMFSSRVSDVGLCFITSLVELVDLEICGGRITDKGLEYISQLPSLQRLNVSQNVQISNSGLHHLASLKDLEALNVSHSQVAAPGALKPLCRLRGLKILAVNGCRGMDDTTLHQIQSSLPNLRTVRAVS
ncbi:hypothetical protein NSK_003794 [Nannochloropsis salina CCMP1776]|uniref:F-box domain-containing protein n=1 Tax=Nannochloropsis salina CCMP1776 TaxID=1027361 RepID=A0A4D9CZE0_9STRA|nr:hypothetical protein NSK_003794 [Nannochloropsis salina CCMP1776]|eukprot:TFJ84762.1 hypothetical protein NSK_003794 [Nannochloropsis salina CCMP1776]